MKNPSPQICILEPLFYTFSESRSQNKRSIAVLAITMADMVKKSSYCYSSCCLWPFGCLVCRHPFYHKFKWGKKPFLKKNIQFCVNSYSNYSSPAPHFSQCAPLNYSLRHIAGSCFPFISFFVWVCKIFVCPQLSTKIFLSTLEHFWVLKIFLYHQESNCHLSIY